MVELFGEPLAMLLLLAGAGLIIAEAFAPGAHFIVLGIALFIAGLVGILLPFGGIAAPIVMAAAALIIGAATLYAYREFDFYGGKGMDQTSDSESLRGKTGRVTERVTETSGEVKLDQGGFNPYFRARSVEGEITEGTEIIVLDPGGGNVVTVESTEGIASDEIDRELARAKREDLTDDEEEREPDPA